MAQQSLCMYLAIGKLTKENGEFKEGKHHILASHLAHKDDSSRSNYVKHISQIMDKGASKLKSGKRIRLTSEESNYELHVLTEAVDGDEDCLVVFFVVTDPEFGKSHSIAKLLDEMKAVVFENNSNEELHRATQGSVQRSSGDALTQLGTKYGTSKLRDVQVKVGQVKQIMEDNVRSALENDTALKDMEATADVLEGNSKKLHDGAVKVKRQQRCKYWKVTALIAVIISIIIIILVASVVPKKK